MAEDLVVFPEHALLIVEELLKEQQPAGVQMPTGVELDELAPPDPDHRRESREHGRRGSSSSGTSNAGQPPETPLA